MAILSTGNTFGATDTVTSTKLNDIANAATFDDPVDDSTLELNTDDGKLRVKASGVGTTQIAPSSVTKAKIENVANMKVLGNTSGSSATPQEVTIYDEDNMASNSDTGLATQQSIKAYVGNQNVVYAGTESASLPNGLIIKQGTEISLTGGSSTTVTFAEAFPNACLNVQATFNSSASVTNSPAASGLSSTEFTLSNSHTLARNIFWLAIGY